MKLWDAHTLEATARQAKREASSTPWVIHPWRNEQGIYLMQFVILQYQHMDPNEDGAK